MTSQQKSPKMGRPAQTNTKKLAITALFCALAYLCMFLFRIKVVFLTFDAKDAILTIGAMAFGPLSALVMSAAVSLLEFLSVSDTGVYGLIMNFLSSAAFSFTAALIYRYRKTLRGAIAGLITAIVSMTAVMMAANLLITPFYMGCERSEVVSMLPTLLLPFNLTKAVLNASLVLLLYKPISQALSRIGVTSHAASPESVPYAFRGRTVWITVIALLLLVGSLAVFFLLHGELQWWPRP